MNRRGFFARLAGLLGAVAGLDKVMTAAPAVKPRWRLESVRHTVGGLPVTLTAKKLTTTVRVPDELLMDSMIRVRIPDGGYELPAGMVPTLEQVLRENRA